MTLRGVVLCVLCMGLIKYHSCYRRHIKDEEGHRHYGWVAQGHCVVCNKYPALIPEFIMPHKHYSAKVIEGVVAESEEGKVIEHLCGCAADISTMRRWLRQFKVRGARAVGWLVSTLLIVYELQIGSLELQHRTVLKRLARLLCEYPLPESGGVIARVNIILTAHNCGFL